jgi:hypothetical protein
MPIKKILPKQTPPNSPNKAPATKKKGATTTGFLPGGFDTSDSTPCPIDTMYSLCGNPSPDDLHLIGVGGEEDGYIAHWFVNAANRWRRRVLTNEELPTLYGACFYKGYFFAVGDSIIMRSDDGDRWQRHSNKGKTLCRIAPGNDRLWIVGESATILSSTDLGESWHRVDAPTQETFFSVFAMDDLVLLGAEDGTFCISHNNGETWELIEGVAGSSINRIWGDAKKLFAACDNGYVLTSTDQGKSWLHTKPQNAVFDLEGGCTTPQGEVYVIGQSEALLYQNTSGEWSKYAHQAELWDAIALGGSVYVCSYDGKIFQQRKATALELKEKTTYQPG